LTALQPPETNIVLLAAILPPIANITKNFRRIVRSQLFIDTANTTFLGVQSEKGTAQAAFLLLDHTGLTGEKTGYFPIGRVAPR